jgi:hypothetical protein
MRTVPAETGNGTPQVCLSNLGGKERRQLVALIRFHHLEEARQDEVPIVGSSNL